MITRRPQRSTILKACLILLVASLILTACKREPGSLDHPLNQSLTSSTSPAFSTKEPSRYQATRIVSLTESSAAGSSPARSTKVFLARDGEQRREEYEAGSLGTIVFLENQSGRFIVLPHGKLYADANEPDIAAQTAQLQVETELMSPDLLLNESQLVLEYQKLGSEVIAGRVTTKYQAASSNSTGSNETSIWVDETLGMPIATQHISRSGENSTRVFTELQNIRTEVDPGTFALPVGYRKVAAAEILSTIRAEKRSPAGRLNKE